MLVTCWVRVGQKVVELALEEAQLEVRGQGDLITAEIIDVLPPQSRSNGENDDERRGQDG